MYKYRIKEDLKFAFYSIYLFIKIWKKINQQNKISITLKLFINSS